MKNYNIPIFIPHEGCPHDCVFCNQRKITGVQTSVTPNDGAIIIKEHLGYLPQGEKYVEVAFFGGSFTGLPLEIQEEFYKMSDEFRPDIQGIRLSTRPDYINSEVLNLAKKYGVTMIELGAQSAVDEVLKKNNRGHAFNDTKEAVRLIKEAKIGVGLQMMVGMYGSSAESDLYTSKALAELNPDCVRIYPVLVLRETGLENLYNIGEYVPLSLEDAIVRAKNMALEFKKKNIPIIRLGLHAGEDLREEGTIAAGPFHPAIGELVESRIWRDKIEEKIKSLDEIPREFEVEAPKSETSKIIGHKRCNAEYFKEKYGVEIKVMRNS